uniref:Uncharacterized protein n=1 Tax=Capra hircus TaxID=9925 RepID=A0A452ER96_CAPHI
MADAPWAEIREKFQTALALSRVELHKNPEKEPYKSKYSARALLEEVKALLGPAPEDEDERPQADDSLGAGEHALGLPAELVEAEGPVAQGAVRRAVIEFHLGVNHIDTEELSAGEEHLVKCLRLLRKYRLSHDCVSLYIQAQNNLGILWSEREEIETAQAYLESSEALYNQYMKEVFAQSCPTLCDCMDWSTPGFSVHHQLRELAQTHVHRVSDAIKSSHPLSFPCPPAFNCSQHQGLFQ